LDQVITDLRYKIRDGLYLDQSSGILYFHVEGIESILSTEPIAQTTICRVCINVALKKSGFLNASVDIDSNNIGRLFSNPIQQDLALTYSIAGKILAGFTSGYNGLFVGIPAVNTTTTVNSVTNTDGTLTIFPSTGDVTARLNVNHSNAWSTTQTFKDHINVDGYSLQPGYTPPTNGQNLTWSTSAGAYIPISPPTNVAVSNVLIPNTNPTTIISTTPSTAGSFVIGAYYRVIGSLTTVTITVNWTDLSGAQSQTLVSSLASGAGNSYTSSPIYISATTSPITVVVTTNVGNTVYVTANVMAMFYNI
jgi:hypothetical protein